MPTDLSNLRQLSAKAGITCFLIFLMAGCTVVRKYPQGTPFVYKTNINLPGDLSNSEKQLLSSRLKAQLEDSLRPRSVSKLFYSVLKNPPVFDSANAGKTLVYMDALLTSLGYFSDSTNYHYKIDTVRDQLRTTVNFNVSPGKVTRIDTMSYNLKLPELQQLATSDPSNALIRKGDPFAKGAIAAELDRLVERYRENGYMRITREEMIGLWDTLDISLLRPTLDPFEQTQMLELLKKRRENPSASLEITLRPGLDSSKLKKFYIGNITVYPDITLDTANLRPKYARVNEVNVVYYRNIFKPKIFPQNIYLKKGDQYDQRNYFRTINRFNSLGAWRLVNIEQTPRRDQDTADFVIRLTPAKKYSFISNLEGSNNSNAVSGNLFGIAMNIGLQNRNFAQAANQANTNIRYGIETGRDTVTDVKFTQTRQLSVSHTIYLPRPIPAMKWIPERVRNSFRTVLSLNAAITERRELYNLNTVNGSWGYNFTTRKKSFTVRIPNIEYAQFDSKPRLDTIFQNNPSLKNIFTDGLISSMNVGVNIPGNFHHNVNNLRLNGEVSGLTLGLVRNKFLDDNLYRFLKFDIDFAQKFNFKRSGFVFHFFGGLGYALNSTINPSKQYNLPFFRQYFAGGPNSMRAWGLRKLGPGSLVRSYDEAPDRYGDVQLETNMEYRFPLMRPFGINFDGALFTDIGNIWFLKSAPDREPEEVFKLNQFAKDLAVGIGAGLRVDFSYFVIRLDYAIKAKDPSPSPNRINVQNKWFGYKNWSEADQFQLAISYPFIL